MRTILRYDEPRLVWTRLTPGPPNTRERGGKG